MLREFNEIIAEREIRRISQRDLAPAVVRGRNISGFILRTSISQSSVALSNGQQVMNQVRISNNGDRRILPLFERAVYVGSVANANLLPGGSGVDESQFQVIGPFNGIIKTDTGIAVDGSEFVNQMYIRNISAGSITLIFRVIVRYIINQGGSGS